MKREKKIINILDVTLTVAITYKNIFKLFCV